MISLQILTLMRHAAFLRWLFSRIIRSSVRVGIRRLTLFQLANSPLHSKYREGFPIGQVNQLRVSIGHELRVRSCREIALRTLDSRSMSVREHGRTQ
jgi:hypothetical protein